MVPVWTRPRYNQFLVFHLQLADVCAWAIDAPVVPKGTGRVRLVFHGANTEAEVEQLVSVICGWAEEMLDIEEGPQTGIMLPSAARQVYGSILGEQADDLANGLPELMSGATTPESEPELPVGQITAPAIDAPLKDTTEYGVPKISNMLDAYGLENETVSGANTEVQVVS